MKSGEAMSANLSVDIAGLRLKNPVMPAPGAFDPFTVPGLVDTSLLGAVVLKSITLNPREGNTPPRVYEVPCGMLNSIGIPGDGVYRFVKYKAPLLKTLKTTVIASVAGFSVAEFVKVVEVLEENVSDIHAYEINLSCPNLEQGGKNCALDEECIYEVTRAVRGTAKKPIIAKLAPDVTDIVSSARVAADAGADAITIANSYRGMAVDLKTRRPVFQRVIAGYTGPAIKPLTLRAVYEVVSNLEIPVIAAGGIASGLDALEYLLVGAKAVQVGTMVLRKPTILIDIIEEIKRFLISEGIGDINEFIGSLEKPGGESGPPLLN